MGVIGRLLYNCCYSGSRKQKKILIGAYSKGEQESDLSDWGQHESCICREEVKGLGKTRKILTVLTLQDEELDNDEDEDFELRFK